MVVILTGHHPCRWSRGVVHFSVIVHNAVYFFVYHVVLANLAKIIL